MFSLPWNWEVSENGRVLQTVFLPGCFPGFACVVYILTLLWEFLFKFISGFLHGQVFEGSPLRLWEG